MFRRHKPIKIPLNNITKYLGDKALQRLFDVVKSWGYTSKCTTNSCNMQNAILSEMHRRDRIRRYGYDPREDLERYWNEPKRNEEGYPTK
jgi:hypothetical protein